MAPLRLHSSPWISRFTLFLAFTLMALASTSLRAQSLSDVVAPFPPPDIIGATLAPDKFLHAGGSAAMVIATYGASSQYLPHGWQRALLSTTVVALAGASKEVFDYARGGRVDPLDLIADAIGIGAGLLVMSASELVFAMLRSIPTHDAIDAAE